MEAQLFVIMGVAGSGKTTIGEAVAARLNCPFYDGDDHHPAVNVAKMGRGIPLTDADREPWLSTLAAILQEHADRDETAVVACSALKKQYRDILRVGPEVQFVFLTGDFDLIWQRLQAREDHYMKATMLHSQFDTLEPPAANEAIAIDIHQPVDAIVDQLLPFSSFN